MTVHGRYICQMIFMPGKALGNVYFKCSSAATMIGLTEKITDAFEDNIGYTLVALVTITILSLVNIPYGSTHVYL